MGWIYCRIEVCGLYPYHQNTHMDFINKYWMLSVDNSKQEQRQTYLAILLTFQQSMNWTYCRFDLSEVCGLNHKKIIWTAKMLDSLKL